MTLESNSTNNDLSFTGNFKYRGFARPSKISDPLNSPELHGLEIEFLSYIDPLENAQAIIDYRSR